MKWILEHLSIETLNSFEMNSTLLKFGMPNWISFALTEIRALSFFNKPVNILLLSACEFEISVCETHEWTEN